MSEPTTARLAAALAEVPGLPPALVRAATDGYYDDYLSPLATPQLQLYADLRALAAAPTTGPAARAAITALLARVINGDFDGTKEEADAWAASPEGQETLAQFFPAGPRTGP